ALPVAITVISSVAAKAMPGRGLPLATATRDPRKHPEPRCGIATKHKHLKPLPGWGSPWWLASFFFFFIYLL
ncbi:hypothetical protein, partial [Enterobacter sichuanensis]